MKYKMKILFWLRKNKLNASNEAAIYCRITINGRRAPDFTTGVITTHQNWDSKKQRIRNDDTKQSTLQTIRQKLLSIHLDLEMKDIPATADLVKNIYSKKDLSQKKMTVNELFAEFIENERLNANKHPQTIIYYKRRIVPFLFFLAETKGREISINDISPRIADELTDHLLQKKNYNPNYVVKIVQIAKMTFNYALKKQYIKQNPFVFVKIKTKQKPLIVLSKDELQRISEHNFIVSRLQHVADLFLLQCYTGMAYVDLMKFESSKIQNGFITIARQKNDSESLIPLLPEAVLLLQKYQFKIPVISNQKYNSYLKEVADIAKIEKPLTTHVGRKTCGSILLNEGVSIEVVSRILGHRDTKITQRIYAKVNELRISREMEQVCFSPFQKAS